MNKKLKYTRSGLKTDDDMPLYKFLFDEETGKIIFCEYNKIKEIKFCI